MTGTRKPAEFILPRPCYNRRIPTQGFTHVLCSTESTCITLPAVRIRGATSMAHDSDPVVRQESFTSRYGHTRTSLAWRALRMDGRIGLGCGSRSLCGVWGVCMATRRRAGSSYSTVCIVSGVER